VQEDVTLSTSGQLDAFDPDLGAQLTWSVAGGNAPHVADYRVQLDNFRVVKNGVVAFNDAFDDGNPPPSAPNFANGSPASYSAASVSGTLTESGGRAVMDGGLGVPFAIGSGTGHFPQLITDTSTNLAPGLKIDDNLMVEGLFDLFVPDDRGEGYGIRLTDHVSGHPGDDAIQLAILRGADGVLRVGLSELDFRADTVTSLGGTFFNPAPQADQVLLRLTHAANTGVVTGSLDLLAGGVVVSSLAVPGSGRIFGTETPGDTSDDEVWTRAQLVSLSSAFVDSGLNGTYGTLTVDQGGRWSYQLANGQANVQALAQGETVTDTFTIQVTDEHGASATQSVTIDVHGTNDAPHGLLGDLPCLLPENLPAGTVIGQLTGADRDATDVLSYSLADSADGRFAVDDEGRISVTRPFDFESEAGPFSITARVTDPHGAFFDRQFTLGVANLNEAPTDINVVYYRGGGANHDPENMQPGTVVARLWGAVDPEPMDLFTYSMVDSAGGRFAIVDNSVVVSGPLDYETARSHEVVVRVTDGGGLSFDETLTFELSNVAEVQGPAGPPSGNPFNRAPSDLYFVTPWVNENEPAGGFVTQIGVVDPDSSSWRFTLLGGMTGPFQLQDNWVYVNGPIDFETQSEYFLTISAVDAEGLGYGETLRIGVIDQPGLNYVVPPTGGVFYGDVEPDVITGSDTADLLDGLGGDDVLRGGMGRDILRGGMGDDVLDGGIWFDGLTPQSFDDLDYASYSSAPGGIAANLSLGSVYVSAFGGVDTIAFIEGIIGSPFDDTLIGGANDFFETFRGGGGSDWIDGGAGFDRAEYLDATTIDGHTGITALLAAGTVMGQGVHTDTLRNIEEIVGSAYDDLFDARGFGTVFGGNVGNFGTFSSFRPGAGDDVLIGNGNSRIDYFDAQDCGLVVDLLSGVVRGGFSVGTDTFSGVNRVRGSMFGDEIYGGTGASFEKFEGMAGNDLIDGRGGFDIAGYAADGNISTGLQVNLAAGSAVGDPVRTGTDTLRSIESIDGSILADVYNAAGFSSSSANAGSFGTLNEFQGRGGNDQVTGNGNTRVSYTDATGAVAVDLQAGTGSGNASVGTDTFLGGVTRVRGSQFDDVLRGDSADNVLEGQGGNDIIEGRGGADTLIGGPGADTFVFGPGGGVDRITDLRSGEGDRLDIRDLLIGFEPSQLSSFVSLSQSGGGTTVSVDRDGAALGYGFQPIVTLDQLLVGSLGELNLVTG
jgi:VCBS repeat-containing protein